MSVTKPTVNKTAEIDAGKDRRAELLAAAAEVFVAKGFHDAKVSDVVTAAGVAQGTFYLYFKTKADVLLQLVNDCCLDIIGALAACSQVKADCRDPKQLRESNVAFLIDLFNLLENKHQAVKVVLSGQTGVDTAIDRALAELKSVLVEISKANLEAGMASGIIRKLDSTIVAEAVVGMIYHIAFERFVLGRRLGVSIRQLAEELVDFELDGIAAE
ncbi:MAG: TetR/AcrR family transcriptional regulator [Actinomycetota bacterium]|nr:TetR/AcrR family transcriptional regulator [Actinomycetota bacterium]